MVKQCHIFKFTLFHCGPGHTWECRMPINATVLRFGEQAGRFVLWAKVPVDGTLEFSDRQFTIVPTGATIENGYKYEDTITTPEGLVFHFFTKISRNPLVKSVKIANRPGCETEISSGKNTLITIDGEELSGVESIQYTLPGRDHFGSLEIKLLSNFELEMDTVSLNSGDKKVEE